MALHWKSACKKSQSPFHRVTSWAAPQNFSSISRSTIATRPADFKANAALSWEDWDLILGLETFAQKFLLLTLLLSSVQQRGCHSFSQIFEPIFAYISFDWTVNEIAKPSHHGGLGCPNFGASQGPWDSLRSPWCWGCLTFTSCSLAAQNNCALTYKSVFPFQTFIPDSLGLQVCLGESNSTSGFQLLRNTLMWAGGEPDPQITVFHHPNPVLPWISTGVFWKKSLRTFCKAQSYLCSHLSSFSQYLPQACHRLPNVRTFSK